MQAAYALRVKIRSVRHLRRRARLDLLVTEAGGTTALAQLVGTPKSHISAMQAGNRGVGDNLAAKLESKMDKPPGWMDQGGELSEEALEYGLLFDAITDEDQKQQARAVIGALLRKKKRKAEEDPMPVASEEATASSPPPLIKT